MKTEAHPKNQQYYRKWECLNNSEYINKSFKNPFGKDSSINNLHLWDNIINNAWTYLS